MCLEDAYYLEAGWNTGKADIGLQELTRNPLSLHHTCVECEALKAIQGAMWSLLPQVYLKKKIAIFYLPILLFATSSLSHNADAPDRVY